MSSAVEDIRIKLEQRLNELEQEIESLRSALIALDVEEAAARSSREPAAATVEAPATRSRRRSGRRARASTATTTNGAAAADGSGRADGASSEELEQLLAEMGGLTAVELARQTGTDPGAVLARIRQLEQAGKSRR